MAARIVLIVAIIVVIIAIGLVATLVFLTASTSTTLTLISQSTTSSPVTSSITTFSPGGNYSSSWLTYPKDLVRSGYDPDEPLYSTSAPTLAWKSPALDGAIYAEPLIYNGEVFVVTENDSVYALTEATGQIVWRQNLGMPVPGDTLPCGDINPSGITSTPVIDPSVGEIFVVAYLYPPQQHVLFALNTGDGKVIFQRTVNPPGESPLTEQQRAALSLANGTIYIPFGGLAGDCGQYHGYVLGVHEDNSSATLSYQVPTTREGAIWAPAGVSIDSTGIYAATGNGASNSAFDFGDSVIHLSFGLNETDYFAPTNWVTLNTNDLDLGSVEPALLGNNTVFQIGKEGVGYLLNESNLGGIGGQEFSLQVCNSVFGGTAFVSPVLYVPCTNGLFALKVFDGGSTAASFSVLWNNTSFDAGAPIIVGGAAWSIDQNTGILHALNLQNGDQVFNYTLGSVVHFETPSAAGGLIFAAGDDSIYAFAI